jgi:hypothetical protein
MNGPGSECINATCTVTVIPCTILVAIFSFTFSFEQIMDLTLLVLCHSCNYCVFPVVVVPMFCGWW